MNLEQELRRALKREDPSAGFDDRVLARIASRETVHITDTRRRRPRVALPIAASLLLAFGSTYYLQQQQRHIREDQAQTEQAARDVVRALQIASETISAAQARVQEITQYEPTSDY